MFRQVKVAIRRAQERARHRRNYRALLELEDAFLLLPSRLVQQQRGQPAVLGHALDSLYDEALDLLRRQALGGARTVPLGLRRVAHVVAVAGAVWLRGVRVPHRLLAWTTAQEPFQQRTVLVAHLRAARLAIDAEHLRN